jgi:hypothetical protein
VVVVVVVVLVVAAAVYFIAKKDIEENDGLDNLPMKSFLVNIRFTQNRNRSISEAQWALNINGCYHTHEHFRYTLGLQ